MFRLFTSRHLQAGTPKIFFYKIDNVSGIKRSRLHDDYNILRCKIITYKIYFIYYDILYYIIH